MAGIAALAAAAAPGDATADALDDIRKRGRLIVGVKADQPPYGFLGSDGKIAGMEPDLAQDVAEVLGVQLRSEEHTSELQSLMRISYAVFCLKKKKIHIQYSTN